MFSHGLFHLSARAQCKRTIGTNHQSILCVLDASFEKRLTELDAIEQRQATALYLQEEKLKNQEGDLLEKQIAKDSIKRAIEQEDENIMKMHQKMAEKQDELKGDYFCTVF